MSRIVQVANFVGPHSGGIRTVLGNLADGYAAAGHEVLQIVPGRTRRRTAQPWGERLELPGTALPGTGYQVIPRRAAASAIAAFAADRVEVHDRTTLRGLGTFARRAGIRSCVVSHERLDRLVAHWTRGCLPTRRVADASNRALAEQFDTVVCTTGWAAAEFERLDVPNLEIIPLGVDHDRFTPTARGAATWRAGLARDEALLAMAIRLSPEKRPAIALDTMRELLRRHRCARLVVAGDGPLRRPLERAARQLPVTFLGHVEPGLLAGLLAAADVVLAPGPVETFGLAALEALACGTPVVANRSSALPSVVGAAGRAADASGPSFATAVEALLAQPIAQRRTAARARSLEFDWSRTVRGFLDVHELTPIAVPA